MDYPELNLVFGLGLLITLVVNIGIRILLSNVDLPRWLSLCSWAALIFSAAAAAYIEILFLRIMTPAFNLKIGLGLLVIGGLGAVLTASLYRKAISPRIATLLFGAQIVASFVSLLFAYILYRSLVSVG